MWALSLGLEDPLEKRMATQSSVLAWEIPYTEEPGGLQSLESQGQIDQCMSMHALRMSALGCLRDASA